METHEQAEQLRHATIDSFNDDELFLSTDELTKRVMANSDGSEWWINKWRTQRSAEMGIARALSQFGVTSQRRWENGNRKGYYKTDVMGQPQSQWWQN